MHWPFSIGRYVDYYYNSMKRPQLMSTMRCLLACQSSHYFCATVFPLQIPLKGISQVSYTSRKKVLNSSCFVYILWLYCYCYLLGLGGGVMYKNFNDDFWCLKAAVTSKFSINLVLYLEWLLDRGMLLDMCWWWKR